MDTFKNFIKHFQGDNSSHPPSEIMSQLSGNSDISEHLSKMSGNQFKGRRYCDTLIGIVKKFDMFNLMKEDHIRKMCKEVSFVNKMLNVSYDIIFRQGLHKDDAIKKMTDLRDRDNNTFMDSKGAEQIYHKFNELSRNINKIGANSDNNAVDRDDISSSKISGGGSKSKKSSKNQRRRRKTTKLSKNKNTYNKLLSYQGGSSSDDDDDDDADDGNMDKKVKTNLSKPQKEMVDKTFDMMEVLLICLSLLPIAGWAFDFPLMIYSIVKKKYTLSMITILNWLIWSMWLLFGMWVNMGPTMKASYLGNQENLVKKSLLFPTKATSKVINPYTQANPVTINGKPYLKDTIGNVFSAEVHHPEMIGFLDQDGTIIKKGAGNYEETLRKIKESKHKKKIGPSDIL